MHHPLMGVLRGGTPLKGSQGASPDLLPPFPRGRGARGDGDSRQQSKNPPTTPKRHFKKPEITRKPTIFTITLDFFL